MAKPVCVIVLHDNICDVGSASEDYGVAGSGFVCCLLGYEHNL